MRPGRVVYIRVNPKDCMSVVDVASKVGLLPPGTAFAQAVSIALSSALESFRQSGVIPVREGFEFSQMMSKFPSTAGEKRLRALSIARALHSAGSDGQVPAVESNPERMRHARRLEELRIKFAGDEINFSEEEKVELQQLTSELDPDPDLQQQVGTREPMAGVGVKQEMGWNLSTTNTTKATSVPTTPDSQ